MHLSRSVVFHSTALLLSGAFLLAIAAAGYYVRFFGGDWGRALQIELLFGASLLAALAVSSGRFRSKLQVFVSKHFFSYRYDYRAEWLRFTRNLSAESSVPRVQEQCIKALADLVDSPGGALWLKTESGDFRPASRLNVAAIDASEPARWLRRTIPRANGMGHRPRRIRGGSGAVRRTRDPRLARVDSGGVARGAAAVGRRIGRIRAPDEAKGRRSTSIGRSGTCSRPQASRRRATSVRSARARRCSRRASSTRSTGCRRSSSTTSRTWSRS